MKKKLSLLFLTLSCVLYSLGATYYVSYSNGLDTYNGSISTPFKTITKAVSVAVAGDVIYLRGGTHVYTSKINVSKNGTSTNRFYLLAYPGDARPVLDFSGMTVADANRGMQLSGNYWHIRGIDFYKAGDNGMHISGAFNIVEFCSFYENSDSGLQLANGANNNQIINCDSYFNADPDNGDADGFACKLDVGTGNSFKGCRAWQNSDDGWDGLLTAGGGTNPSTTYDSCWCFLNGYLKSGVASVGNGNGFKMGGNNELHDATLTRCLSAFNRVKGFDQNNNNGSMTLYNCTGYQNKPNFGMNNNDPSSGKVMIVKNCVSYLSQATDVFRTVCVRTNNSWQSPFVTDAADFLSVDSIGIRGPRNANGTLPHINFMHLAGSSDLINGGTNVGLPYNGSAPDLGAFETDAVVPVSLLSFDAILKGNNVMLNWETLSEINNKGWDIERIQTNKTAVDPWQVVGFVGSSNNRKYAFANNGLVMGNTYQYRLKQIDLDGYVKYSNVVTVKLNSKNELEVVTYPNPSRSFVNVRYTVAAKGTVSVSVYNANGQLINNFFNGTEDSGTYIKTLNIANLNNGTYIVQLSAGSSRSTTSFVKQ